MTMIRKVVFPLLAVVGIVFSVWLVITSAKPVPYAQPVVEPPQASFPSFVAGAGIVETSTQNIAIATPVSGVVTEVLATVGGKVKPGDPLFKLDDRTQKAELETRQATLRIKKEQLERLKRMPRTEEIPPAEAQLKQAEASLADLKNQLALANSISDKRALSKEEIDKRRYAVEVAEAKVEQAKTNLSLLKAGSWRPDMEVARAQHEEARAQVQAQQTEIERLIVRAPVEGETLQVNVRVGEFAQAGVLQTPLMLLGNADLLHVRVDIDENDAWRVRQDAHAVAFVRGNKELSTTLSLVRIEPFIIPKRSLTGDSTERVDTRVLQAIYSFKKGDMPIYVGQQMDVFIEAAPATAAGQSVLSKNDAGKGGQR